MTTSVTDAEARNVLLAFNHWYLWGPHDVQAMRRVLEQFTQSRHPSSEAVELPKLNDIMHLADRYAKATELWSLTITSPDQDHKNRMTRQKNSVREALLNTVAAAIKAAQ